MEDTTTSYIRWWVNRWGVFYLPHSTGLESDGNGGYTYGIADLNGGGVSLEDGEDRYVAGQAVPKTILGSNISFRYKRFDLSLQVNGAFGHKIYNGTSLTYMNMNIFPDYNVMQEAPARNIKDQTATDYWLENGAYVNFRLRDTRLERTDRKGAETKEICSLPATGIYSQQPGNYFRLFGTFTYD